MKKNHPAYQKLKWILLVAVFLIVNFNVLAQENLSSSGLAPDSFFYFLDVWGEKIVLFFTFNAANKTERALNYAEEKLAEAKEMVKKNDIENLEKSLKKYQGYIFLINKKIDDVGSDSKVERLINLIMEKFISHQKILQEFRKSTPDNVWPLIADSRASIFDMYVNAIRKAILIKHENVVRPFLSHVEDQLNLLIAAVESGDSDGRIEVLDNLTGYYSLWNEIAGHELMPATEELLENTAFNHLKSLNKIYGKVSAEENELVQRCAILIDRHCKTLLPDHNQNKSDRVNLVFMAGALDTIKPTLDFDTVDLFRVFIVGSQDSGYGFGPEQDKFYAPEGLNGLEPFSSNLDKFNFWYVDVPLFKERDDCGPTVADCYLDSKMVYSCSFPNKHVHVVYGKSVSVFSHNDSFKFWEADHRVSFQGWSFGPGDVTLSLASHLFPQFVNVFSQSFTANNIFSEHVNEGQTYDGGNQIFSNCIALPAEIKTPADCVKNEKLPWQDLIGSGCGEWGVVDCEITTSYKDRSGRSKFTKFDDWIYEVRDDVFGCAQGCGGSFYGSFRPNMACNIMYGNGYNCDIDIPQEGYITGLGVVNEREICRKIKEISGEASQYCRNLCLDGCGLKQRCVEGACVLKSDLDFSKQISIKQTAKQIAATAESNPGSIPIATIGGYVFVDTNKNKIFDEDEFPFRDMSLRLTQKFNGGLGVGAFVVPDEKGYFELNVFQPGFYVATGSILSQTDMPFEIAAAGISVPASGLEIKGGEKITNYNFAIKPY